MGQPAIHKLRPMAFTAARMTYKYPRQFMSIVLAIWVLTLMLADLGWTWPARQLTVPVLVTWYAVTGYWFVRFVARAHTAKTVIARKAELAQRQAGVASRLDVAEHASKTTLRLKAPVLRPSTYPHAVTGKSRRAISGTQLGVELARLGWGWWGEQIWSSCEDATLRIGGPRSGKTLSMACHGLDAPGALITTSTRLDIAEIVHHTRTAKGAVHFFNPGGIGGLASTVRWRILDGCQDFATAMRRADDLIPESSGEGERWDMQARRILSLFLHAAALAGKTMRDLVRWTSEITPSTLEEITTALMLVPDSGRHRAQEVRAFWGKYDRGRDSVLLTMATPLAWMSDDRARALGDAHPADPGLLDIRGLLERGETLHLIGHAKQGALSPLIAALVAEITDVACQLAATKPGGRLDPPLTMVLDEAAIVCPVPLDRWTADMGGRGVTIHISVQSLAQLRQVWGDHGGAVILGNIGAFMVFGGGQDADDLTATSVLTGEHRMKVIGEDHQHDKSDDGERRGEYRWGPVLSPAQLRALDPYQVLILKRFLLPVVGWTPNVTARKDYRPAVLITRTRQHDAATAPGTSTGRRLVRRGIPSQVSAISDLTTAELEAMLDDSPASPASETGISVSAAEAIPGTSGSTTASGRARRWWRR